MMKRHYTLFALGVAILASCGSKGEKTEEKEIATPTFCLSAELKKSTTISEMNEVPITEQLTLSGKIEYNENDLVAYRSLLEGVVEQVRFELGDFVNKGQVLATIKSLEIQDLYRQQQYQQNQISLLQQQKLSKESLLRDGLISAPELLETTHELEGAKIELKRIEESLTLFKAAGNGLFHIVAPKKGYIIQKSISSGQAITKEDDPLFSISNLKEVWAMVNIYASNLRFVHTGDQVKIRTIAYPDQLYNGRIDKIYNVFDDNEHVLKARVVLENQKLNLVPGLSADIIIDKKNNLGMGIPIPRKAIVFSNNKEYVLVYTDDCHIETRQIAPVASNEEYVFVRETVLPKDKIVTSNALLIYEHLNQ
ncbi:efflux RND transporter periplasmic adaptor subunit [Sphingobacterium psychroaquaticum]|nr:efflux RND transporter periplasmic adaptor subunit [Sphingobacterium psychroaquaticum]